MTLVPNEISGNKAEQITSCIACNGIGIEYIKRCKENAFSSVITIKTYAAPAHKYQVNQWLNLIKE